MLPKEKILVTGASGFIGGWIAESLHFDKSTDVRAGIRTWSSAARLSRFPIEVVLCDVMDKEQIAEAMTDITCVIHTAYGSKEVTVQGTKNMLDVALDLGIQRFIHISTTEVYGNVNGDIDESFPYQSTGTPYGDSKIEAEKLCWEYHDKGLPVTVIRPPIVYGPFGRTWTVELAGKLQSGNWNTLMEFGDGICNLIYVEDLVSGILLASRSESCAGEAFNLSGPESLTWNEYFQRYSCAIGMPSLETKSSDKTKIHALLMEPVRSMAKVGVEYFGTQIKTIGNKSALVKSLLKSAEKYIKTVPRLADLSLYSREAHYNATKAHEVLDFQPKFDVQRGLELTVQWLDHVGLIENEITP